ncbi:efflux RND transporter periplasmic adaptor subunit [Flavobacterium sharifuzzamanii]|uniref:efflux RND transporter periplasmic adaptor subunit n=1 Tax=Flavobacterium sharifuzzamanii TaxID=2211133 RepID=UPI00130086A1|nr:efflux RND transporter periplasmic adaptor subunit [Flavobacterium sharifuzzamanii]KAF2080130.1 efflux RND transporter periplasmic adaptor subunit [Flavobacterium sharifuzzamanii]
MQVPKPFCLFIFSVLLFSCQDKENFKEADLSRAPYSASAIMVKTETLRPEPFAMELMCTGKLQGFEKATVPFLLNETVVNIRVHNGQRIAQGQVLAVLEPFNYKQEVERSGNSLENARLEMANMLLGAGYSIGDTAHIPAEQWRIYKLKSGYTAAALSLKDAMHKLSQTFVKAPISGVVTGLEAKAFNPASGYKNCCVLVSDAKMEVGFHILESQISAVQKGQSITLVPYALPELKASGSISEINPVIDENGMVAIKALVNNSSGKLIDGMNVKVLVKNTVGHQLAVPKSAVLVRQGKHIVFTYRMGMAIWNYVTLGLENSTQFCIADGLKPGDEIIVSNNFNLAHQTAVKVNNNSN